jgi:TonB family protein
MTIRIVLVAAAALLAAVPASAQQIAGCRSIGPRPVPRTAPLNRREAADSVRQAAQAAVVDSLKSAVLEAARQGGVAQPEGLVILEVRGPRPERTEIHLWRANVSDDAVRSVLASRGPLLATLPERETTLHFRLNDLPRDGTRSDSLMECPPRPGDVSRFVQEITRASQSQPPLPAGSNPNPTLQVRMLVSREGEVAHARLARRTHQPSLDAAILAAARRLRFTPASVAGVPLDVWVEQPVNLQVAVEPRRSRS